MRKGNKINEHDKLLENLTCIPPTPITNSSCPINSDASKLNKAVPANERRSEKRLKIENKRWFKVQLKFSSAEIEIV